MTAAIAGAAWDSHRMEEAIAVLAARQGVGRTVAGAEPGGVADRVSGPLHEAVEPVAAASGLTAEEVECPVIDLPRVLPRLGPAIIQLPGEERFLACTGSARSLRILRPDHATVRVPVSDVADLLRAPLEEPHEPWAEELSASAGVSGRRRARARQALLDERIAQIPVARIWTLAAPGPETLRAWLGSAGVVRRLATVLLLHAVGYSLWFAAWGLLGWMAFHDQVLVGWVVLWALICLSMFPLRIGALLVWGRFVVDAGAALKGSVLRRLLRADSDATRQTGAGRAMGLALELDTLDHALQGAALVAVIGAVELLVVAVVLWILPGGWPLALLLVGWTAGISALLLLRRMRALEWTRERVTLSSEMLEQMTGHRTRAAQAGDDANDAPHDARLQRYHSTSRRLDRLEVALEGLLPRGWLLIALAYLGISFTLTPADPIVLGAMLGSVVLAWRTFRLLSTNLAELAVASVAWDRVRELIGLPVRIEFPGTSAGVDDVSVDSPPRATRSAEPAAARDHVAAGGRGAAPVLRARAVGFSRPGRAVPVLSDVDLTIDAGDRLLIEGPSGCGKTTLASILAGARMPSSGLLFLRGLDMPTLGGRSWRRRVVLVPQFHDNYVFTGTFAYNVLIGRGWPAGSSAVQESEAVCRALGLGPLIDRMPSGMFQIVGETGWQLSHGEQSRLFIARALVQNPDLIILDESLAALDPETVRDVMRYLLARDSALAVIAHP